MKNILVITDTIDVNTGSGPKANIAIIDNLIACGYNVEVIHNTINQDIKPGFKHTKIHIRKWSPLFLIGLFTRLLFRYTNVNLNIWFEPLFGFSAEFFTTCNAFARAINNRKDKYDLVITLSKGASFRPHYAMLNCRKFHTKWLAYIHDPYPFHLYPRPYTWFQPGYRQKQQFFTQVSINAKFTAFPGMYLMKWVSYYFPKMANKSVIIPHQISNNEPEYYDVGDYWDTNNFNILHAGNLLAERDPRGLTEGFKIFIQNNPEAKKNTRLYLIGPSSYHENYLKTIASYTHEIVVTLENIPYRIAYWLQNGASVNIIMEADAEVSPFLPGKFPHCVKSQRPILLLCPYYSETRNLLGTNYDYWSELDDSNKIAAVLEKLYNEWLIDKNKSLHRPDLIDYMSYNNLKRTIEKCLDEINHTTNNHA